MRLEILIWIASQFSQAQPPLTMPEFDLLMRYTMAYHSKYGDCIERCTAIAMRALNKRCDKERFRTKHINNLYC